MKKIWMLAIFTMLCVSLSGCDKCEKTGFEKIGDSLATIGKSGVEKDRILAERSADRAANCVEKVGDDVKKNLGID